MNLCIGFLELNSIAKGIEAADRILKTAETRLLFAKAGCPGKYYILFSGEVASVTSSLEAGKETGGAHVVDSVVIPSVHPMVISAINQAVEPVPVNALGVMEFFSVTASVLAADAAVKGSKESPGVSGAAEAAGAAETPAAAPAEKPGRGRPKKEKEKE